jgi:hypothetical protein
MNTDTNTPLKIGGVFSFEQIRNGEIIDTWEEKNIVVDEGINYVLNTSFFNAAANASWFVGLFKNNYTPVAGNVMSTFTGAGVANEVTTEYSQATRPAWTLVASTVKSLTNTASPAAFTFTPPTTTVYGAFLSSSSVKGGTSGVLASAIRFAASRTLLTGDILNVTYTLNGSSI